MSTTTPGAGSALLVALLERLTERLDGWMVDDLTVRLVPERTRVGELQMDVLGEIQREGRRCGFFHGYAVPAPVPRDSWVVLNAIELDVEARGRDFARALVSRILGVVDELGFRRALVHGFGLGGYLRADSGFVLQHPALPDGQTSISLLGQAEVAGVLDALDPAAAAQLDQLRDHLDAKGQTDSPGALLAFSDRAVDEATRKARHRLARTVLAASDWWGVREHDPAEHPRIDRAELNRKEGPS